MDEGRFDELTRRLAVLGARRASRRALLAAAAASGLSRQQPGLAVPCKAASSRCADHSECCSAVCKKSKGKKKKNGKRRNGKKMCRGNGLVITGCVGLWGDCNGPQCCGALACLNDMHKCCAPSGAACSSTAECCTYGGLDVVCKAIDGPPQCCRPKGVYCYQDGQCCSGHCDGLACAA